ncbi:MAG: ATP synthase subunit C [Promethearchaeota archaeon]
MNKKQLFGLSITLILTLMITIGASYLTFSAVKAAISPQENVSKALPEERSSEMALRADVNDTVSESEDYKGMIALAAGIAIALAGGAAALGMASAGSAAIGAMAEKPEIFGKALIFVVFIEAVAIYGFVIAFLLIQAI